MATVPDESFVRLIKPGALPGPREAGGTSRFGVERSRATAGRLHESRPPPRWPGMAKTQLTAGARKPREAPTGRRPSGASRAPGEQGTSRGAPRPDEPPRSPPTPGTGSEAASAANVTSVTGDASAPTGPSPAARPDPKTKDTRTHTRTHQGGPPARPRPGTGTGSSPVSAATPPTTPSFICRYWCVLPPNTTVHSTHTAGGAGRRGAG